jgi:hypothetical protein
VGDLVWAGTSEKGPWLLAVSGKDGSVLWLARPQVAQKGLWQAIAPPLLTDVDGDGVPDLVVLYDRVRVHYSTPFGEIIREQLAEVSPWVEAFSGRTGRTLWRYELGPEKLHDPGLAPGVLLARGKNALALAGSKDHVLVVAGTYQRVVGLHARTGKPVWPVRDLSAPLLGLTKDGRFAVIQGSGPPSLLSLETGEVLWQGSPLSGRATSGDRPQGRLANLHGDGKPDVLYAREVLDGATGVPLWRRTSGSDEGVFGMPPAPDLVVPDLNGDGHPDLLVPDSRWVPDLGHPAGRALVRQETISGQDGRLLAHRQHQLNGRFLARPSAGPIMVRILAPQPPGRPRVALTYHPDLRQGGPRRQKWLTALFKADGDLEHTWPEVFEVASADLDGDAVPDLYGLSRDRAGVRLRAVRGYTNELWRRPGFCTPAIQYINWERGPDSSPVRYITPPLPEGDLDGDGVPDILVLHAGDRSANVDGYLRAYSGRDGHHLWSLDVASLGESRQGPDPPTVDWVACRDLDGDGRLEVVVVYRATEPGVGLCLRLLVLSGGTGKALWKARVKGPGFWERFRFVDLNGDGTLDVVGPNEAFDGRTGRALPVTAPVSFEGNAWFSLQNGERMLDLTGNGGGDLLSFHDGKLRLMRFGRVVWERIIPDAGPAEVRAIRVDLPGQHPVIAVWSGAHTLYGVDGLTGDVRWRCDGPGTPGEIVPCRAHEGPPLVFFHLSGSEATACVQAIPTAPDGSPGTQVILPPDASAPAADLGWWIPYPWEAEARERLGLAVWPALVCVGLILAFARARRWRTALLLTTCLLAIPPFVGVQRLPPEALSRYNGEYHTLGGFLLVWPYTLTTWRGWELLQNPLAWMLVWIATLVALTGLWHDIRWSRRP